MRKALCVLFAAAFALSSLTGTASAEPQVPAQALTCPAGTLCVWPVPDGSNNRCSWLEDNPNWGTWCSWSSSRPVRAAYNNKSNYPGVCLYTGTYYRGTAYFIERHHAVAGPGVIIRSHRWTTSAC
jgi:hypothetical protein